MSSIITNIIGAGNFEIIRSRIASILSDEIANQRVLIQAAIDLNPPASELEELNFALSCLPTKVYEQRFIKPQQNEKIVLNVYLNRDSLDQLTANESQQGDTIYVVDAYFGSNSTFDANGDVLSSTKLQRLMAVCRTIIMDARYRTLGFDFELGIISHRSVRNLRVTMPDDQEYNGTNLIRGVIDVNVSIVEDGNIIEGTELAAMDTEVKLSDDKGFYFTCENN